MKILRTQLQIRAPGPKKAPYGDFQRNPGNLFDPSIIYELQSRLLLGQSLPFYFVYLVFVSSFCGTGGEGIAKIAISAFFGFGGVGIDKI